MKNGRVFLVLALWLGCWGFAWSAPAPAGQSFSTYPVGAADPEVLLEAVQAAAGPEAHVSYDARQQRLLVLAPPEQQARIAELVQAAAPAPVNVRIEVRWRGRERRLQDEVGLSGGVGLVREPGLRHTTIHLEPRIQQETVQSSSDVQQILVVASGREALLRVGEEVPALDWLMEYGVHQGLLAQRVVWQEVGAFLVVQPWVLENRLVRLRMIPELRGLAGGHSQAVRFASAATEVVVPDGQPYALAGLRQAHEVLDRFLIGQSSQANEGSLDITVTPRVLTP